MSISTQQVANYLPQDVRNATEDALTEINSYVEVDLGYSQSLYHSTRYNSPYIGVLDPNDYRIRLAEVYRYSWPTASPLALPASFDTLLQQIASACKALVDQLSEYIAPLDYKAAIDYALTAVANYYHTAKIVLPDNIPATLDSIIKLRLGPVEVEKPSEA